ncbi:MAG: hypothetical protein ACK4RK_15530 [Gemmataceae bacterium]
MKRLFPILVFLAAAHLTLAACSAAHWRLPPDNTMGKFLAWYGSVSGAGSTFPFFAPKVAPQLKATFTLTDAEGQTWTEEAEQGDNREANLRYLSTINLFSYPEVGEAVAASWAAHLLGNYSDAQTVQVQVDVLELPSMEHYRDGDRPRWRLLYQRSFTRDPSARNDTSPKRR